jgi:ERCC4-related helicase
MVATVRNRRGVISSVRPFDGRHGRLHLVELEYNDGEYPLEESLLLEREAEKHLVPPAALPQADIDDPMPPEDLTALVRACRWTARTPFIDPDGTGPIERLPVSSPFHGAVQVEDYQLVPLLKALQMPRVSLLIADDVGLGKTIEAGLILSELLLRRRIRRVLIATPASLRVQWQEEMWEKFSLPFTIVDRDSTARLRRELGMDANPWRSHSRIITSYHYLKQPDVLEQFRAAQRVDANSAHLPWDLLIVDEAHNLTPSPFGDDSELCQMLRQVSPMFEHRLFLTATPHNGHTRSFTGMLELLDPVRFSQKDKLTETDRERVRDVVVRRLKREINAWTTPPKFCDRAPPRALAIDLHPAEKQLVDAFTEFRTGVRRVVAQQGRRKRLAGNFAIEILGKRLLSCPVSFADSWRRCRLGMAEDADAVTESEVIAAKRAVDDETGDDREAESRTHTASTTVGAWMRPFVDDLSTEIEALDRALSSLGLADDRRCPTDIDPVGDSRFDELLEWIESHLTNDGGWRDDERLIVFTEYKTTLDYLLRRLRAHWPGEQERFLSLFGGMDESEREAVKAAFNDPGSQVRVLVGTDAASEGLNLQLTARYVLHYDVPWNPARLEQRNGRLDRHGQARDVSTFHFVTPEDQDLAFLDLVVGKVHTIREDLGATAQVFDELTHRRLVEGVSIDEIRHDLDASVEAARQSAEIDRDSAASTEGGTGRAGSDALAGSLAAIAAELDFDPEALRLTLDGAMAVRAGRPRVSPPGPDLRCSIVQPHPESWNAVIDDSLRLPTSGANRGALPKLAFDPRALIVRVGARSVFRPRPDTTLLHLGHPVIQRAMSDLTRQRFPGGTERPASRWTVFRGTVPENVDALLRLSVEEMATNELRETFHHWVRTLLFPVRNGRLQPPQPHQPAAHLESSVSLAPDLIVKAAEIWADVERDLKGWLRSYTESLGETLTTQVELDRQAAHEQENTRYQSRQGEVSALIATTTMARLEKEIAELRARRRQGLLFDEQETFDALDRDIETKEIELRRRQTHYAGLRDQLNRERERILNHVIPRRHTMRGAPQVMPVAVEVVLPG